MNRIFKDPGHPRLPQRGNEPQNDEYGIDEKGVEQCSTCKNVYFKKQWRAEQDVDLGILPGERKPVHERICPACHMIAQHTFEGEIRIENIPDNFKQELLNLIKNSGDQATSMDPQDRIIAVEDHGKSMRVTTTENQMAVRLAKKIKSAFNAVEVDISYAAEPAEVSHVRVNFIPK